MPFDPNGCIFWNGRYHLGYIYQDSGATQVLDTTAWTLMPTNPY